MIPYTQAALMFVFAAFVNTSATAGDTCMASSGSGVTIRATPTPGAVAEVEFENTSNDGLNLDLACVISLDDLAVAADLTLGRGASPDTALLTPPEGYVAIPSDLTLDDGDSGVSLIFPEGSLVGF